MRKISILVVDDHPIIRRGISQIVSEEGDMIVTGEAADGGEALAKLSSQEFNVVTLDLTLSKENGFDVLEAINSRYPELPVLIISMYEEEHNAMRAIKAGAAGYLCKDTLAEVLVSAIRKVATGGKFITPRLAEQLAVHLNTQTKALHENLSAREFQVLRLLAMGKSLKQIGESLFLSIKTVSTYKTRIFEKMQFQNNADLIKYVIQAHLVDDLLPKISPPSKSN
ncbi:MAG: response regulator transcription factor [Candidatus Riflebacteria bacterium]|nr:response regulator transcription factor [Candidatus Riflebacteria bacterium]